MDWKFQTAPLPPYLANCWSINLKAVVSVVEYFIVAFQQEANLTETTCDTKTNTENPVRFLLVQTIQEWL